MSETPYAWCSQKLDTIIDHSRQFALLDKKQMVYKALPDRWNAEECLIHIMVINELYFEQLYDIIDGKHKNPIIAPLSKTFGKMLVNNVTPGSKKAATMSIFEPSNKSISEEVPKAFMKHLEEFKNILNKLNHVDLKKTKVHSPASKLFKFNLEDCLRILILHTERHVIQAFEEIKKLGMS